MTQPVPGLVEQDPLPQSLHRDPATIPQGGPVIAPTTAKEVPRGFHPFPADPPPRPGRYLGLTAGGPVLLHYRRAETLPPGMHVVALGFYPDADLPFAPPAVDAVAVHAWRVVPPGWA